MSRPDGTITAPPPGWYPDPRGPGLRYWRGERWTDHLLPAGAPHRLYGPTTASRPRPACHVEPPAES